MILDTFKHLIIIIGKECVGDFSFPVHVRSLEVEDIKRGTNSKIKTLLRSVREMRPPGKQLPSELERKTARYRKSQLTRAATSTGTSAG